MGIGVGGVERARERASGWRLALLRRGRKPSTAPTISHLVHSARVSGATASRSSVWLGPSTTPRGGVEGSLRESDDAKAPGDSVSRSTPGASGPGDGRASARRLVVARSVGTGARVIASSSADGRLYGSPAAPRGFSGARAPRVFRGESGGKGLGNNSSTSARPVAVLPSDGPD